MRRKQARFGFGFAFPPFDMRFWGPWGFRGWGGFPRRSEYLQMLEEYKEALEEYKAELEEELRDVEREIEALKRERE
jgi:hypothetical protein